MRHCRAHRQCTSVCHRLGHVTERTASEDDGVDDDGITTLNAPKYAATSDCSSCVGRTLSPIAMAAPTAASRLLKSRELGTAGVWRHDDRAPDNTTANEPGQFVGQHWKGVQIGRPECGRIPGAGRRADPWSGHAGRRPPQARLRPPGLGSDRYSRFVLLVSLAVRKVRQDGCDVARAGAPSSIQQEEQLDQVVVRVRLARLDDEHVTPAHVLFQVDLDRPVRERSRPDPPGRVVKGGADAGCDRPPMMSSRCRDRPFPSPPTRATFPGCVAAATPRSRLRRGTAKLRTTAGAQFSHHTAETPPTGRKTAVDCDG